MERKFRSSDTSTTNVKLILKSPVVTILFFLSSQLFARGISIVDSTFLALWFFSNLIIGTWIYTRSTHRFHAPCYEIIAIGSIIGIALCAILDQFFVFFGIIGFVSKGWVGAAALIIFFKRNQSKEFGLIFHSNNESKVLITAFIATMVPLAAMDYISASSLIIYLLFGIILCFQQFQKYVSQLVYISILLATQFQSYLGSQISHIPKYLLPLATGSDDQIKSEQLAFSLANWGLGSKSSAIGFPVKFHWLSLAWSGSISSGVLSDPFMVTLHFVPLVGFLIASLSAVALAMRISKSYFLWTISPFIMVTSAGVSGAERFFFVLTTTNLIPHLFVIAMFFFILNYLEDTHRIFNVLWIVIWPSIVLLGKGPYAVSVVLGLICMTSNWEGRFRINRKHLFLFLASVLLVILSYAAFFKSIYTDTYVFSIRHLISNFPSPLAEIDSNSRLVRLVLSIFIFFQFFIFRFPILFFFCIVKIDFRLKMYLIGGSVAAIVSFIAYQSGSESYFMNAALTFSAIGNIYLFSDVVKPFNNPKRLLICQTHILRNTFIFASLLVAFSLLIPLVGTFQQTLKVFTATMPMVLLVFLIIAGLIFSVSLSRLLLVGLICIPLVFGNFDFSTSSLPSNPSFLSNLDFYSAVRDKVPKGEIIATNHEICRKTVDCDIGAGMPVLTAFSQRQFLIDGARSLLPTKYWKKSYPESLAVRVDAVYKFIDTPSLATLMGLRTFGVKWLIVDLNGTKKRNWEIYSSIVFRSSNFILLKLNSI